MYAEVSRLFVQVHVYYHLISLVSIGCILRHVTMDGP